MIFVRAAKVALVSLCVGLGAGCGAVGSVAESPDPNASDSAVAQARPTGQFDVVEARAAQLEEMAKAYAISDPPAVGVVREIAPEEQPDVQAQCMSDQGFPADGDGIFNAPLEQADALHLAMYRCTAMYPLAEKYVRPLSEAQMRIVYGYYKDTLVPCLTARGLQVPDPPTVETFLASAGTENEYSPFGSASAALTPKELEELERACPPLPAASVLYADN